MCHRSFRVLEFPNVSYDPHGNKLQRKKYTTIVSNSSEDSVKKKKKNDRAAVRHRGAK